MGSSYKRISGTTWDVYMHILTSREPTGVREVWRELKLSSPSLAQYHINKLLDLKLIETVSDGKYQTNKDEPVEALRSFVLLRGKLIPRLVFYGALLSGVFISYLAFWPFRWDFRDLVVLAVSVFSISIFFFEAYNQYRGLQSSF
ncbi:MAG: helix-turn-helix domain-containing protein [Candidatus Bathyarchaeota archaeon]